MVVQKQQYTIMTVGTYMLVQLPILSHSECILLHALSLSPSLPISPPPFTLTCMVCLCKVNMHCMHAYVSMQVHLSSLRAAAQHCQSQQHHLQHILQLQQLAAAAAAAGSNGPVACTSPAAAMGGSGDSNFNADQADEGARPSASTAADSQAPGTSSSTEQQPGASAAAQCSKEAAGDGPVAPDGGAAAHRVDEKSEGGQLHGNAEGGNRGSGMGAEGGMQRGAASPADVVSRQEQEEIRQRRLQRLSAQQQ